jgi:Bacterial antitoxin of type II TA system, VapB
MKKTLHIDEQLLREAKSAAGAKTDTDTVRLGLEALIRRAAYERLRALRGSERPEAASVISGWFVLLRKFARTVGPAPVGDGLLVRSLSSCCQESLAPVDHNLC